MCSSPEPEEKVPKLWSPEKALTSVPGKDIRALRRLAIVLARVCFFGDDILGRSTISGRAIGTMLDHDKMERIKETIR